MKIKVYNVQNKKHHFRNYLITLLVHLLYFTHVINGYSRYGKIQIKDEHEDLIVYDILLEEVSRTNDDKSDCLL